jgi:hypothetical protein
LRYTVSVTAARSDSPIIVPLSAEQEAGSPFTAAPLTVPVPEDGSPVRVQVRGEGIGGRVGVFIRAAGDTWAGAARESGKEAWSLHAPRRGKTVTLGLSATPGVRDGSRARAFTLLVNEKEYPAVIAPVLLASSLDPVEEVLVVRNQRTAGFCETLAALLPWTEEKPALRPLDHADSSSDLWMQDTVEIGRVAVPETDGKTRQIVAPLLGLRAKHDMGLNCAPLDALVGRHFERTRGAVPITVGEPLPGRRWIDWFGNLEVSPSVKGFPHGRILTGEQKGLRIHPDLLAFLEAQQVQWPPLFLDVSWLTIGHVDELINFVPAPDRQGFRALLPSPALARRVLETLAKEGRGDALVFPGKKTETTVQRLLEEAAKSDETKAIEASLMETRARLKEGLGIEAADIVEMPVLFREGLAVIPNGVNSLVIGRDVIVPDPCGPIIGGEDRFQTVIREQLAPLGLRLHFVDIWEPYHTRAGEIHCGTNTVRRLRNPLWWKATL